MKKYIFITSIALLFIFASCEDILTEEPKAIAVSTYYNTADEIEAGVNAIYYPQQNWYAYKVYYPLMQVSFSDFLISRGSYVRDYETLNASDLTRAKNAWSQFYLSIRNANLIIKNAPNGTNISEEELSMYLAEAKFMRAFSYFNIVKNWGSVPLRTEDNLTESDVPLTDESEMWLFIVEDLEEAEANLPDEPSAVGRPSKWAAKTLFADVYFYQGLNDKAAEKAKEVINSGKYSLIEVETWEDFDTKLFGPDVVGSDESIFSIIFGDSGTSIVNYMYYLLHNGGAGYSGGKGNYAIRIDTLENTVYQEWDSSDIRKDLLYYYENGLGSSSYYCRKWNDPDATAGAGHDFPVYRYADLLLIYAEASCIVNGAPTADGMEALNKVHRRAYGKNPLAANSEVDFKISDYDKSSFVDLVIQERGYETLFEGKRWSDLKRTGRVQEFYQKNRGISVADACITWPIPDSEIEYNNAISEGE